MKKLFLIAAVILGTIGIKVAFAGEVITVPSARTSNPLPDTSYGGVEIATMSFSSGPLCVACVSSVTFANQQISGVIYGVIFSSQTGTVDYVDFYDTNTALTGGVIPGAGGKQALFRVYTDTSANNNLGFGGTSRIFNWPIRFSSGLQVAGNSNLTNYNNISVLFWRRK